MADQDPRVSRWAGEDMFVALRVHLDPELFVFGSDDATRYVQECLDRLAVLEGSNVQAEAVEDRPEVLGDGLEDWRAHPRASSELSHHGRIVKRLMTFGGFQRTERGEFWVSRDDVLRLLEEEFGADAVEDRLCPECEGSGFGFPSSNVNGSCPLCGGSGRVPS